MERSDWKHIVETSELFSDLDEPTLQHVLDDTISRERSVKQGVTLFNEGDPGNSVYIVVSGCIEITRSTQNGRQMRLSITRPGELFGEIAVLGGGRRSATAIAVEDSTLREIDGTHFSELLSNPKFQLKVFSLLTLRLRHADEAILSAGVNDIREEVDHLRNELVQEKEAFEIKLDAWKTIFQETKDKADQVISSGAQQANNLRFLSKVATVIGTAAVIALGWLGIQTVPDLFKARDAILDAQRHVDDAKSDVDEKVKDIGNRLLAAQQGSNEIQIIVNDKVEQLHLDFKSALNTPDPSDELEVHNTLRALGRDDVLRLVQYIEEAMVEDKNKQHTYSPVLVQIIEGPKNAATNPQIARAFYLLVLDMERFPEMRSRIWANPEKGWTNMYQLGWSRVDGYFEQVKEMDNWKQGDAAVCDLLSWRTAEKRIMKDANRAESDLRREVDKRLNAELESMLQKYPSIKSAGRCKKELATIAF
jgi:CRP-like cAMP-binding protein